MRPNVLFRTIIECYRLVNVRMGGFVFSLPKLFHPLQLLSWMTYCTCESPTPPVVETLSDENRPPSNIPKIPSPPPTVDEAPKALLPPPSNRRKKEESSHGWEPVMERHDLILWRRLRKDGLYEYRCESGYWFLISSRNCINSIPIIMVLCNDNKTVLVFKTETGKY